MMKYEAQITFAGQVAMRKGEVRELDRSLAAPLVKCGYLKEKRAVKKGQKGEDGRKKGR